MKIGFCGLGLMGTPMVRRLLRAGHEVHVWNRTAAKAKALRAEGARVCETPEALARACEWVCLCLFDARAVEDVVFGAEGLALAPSLRVVIDHSSIDPDATRALAARLARDGASWVDAPVSGGTGGAQAGTLAIMAGGDQHIFDRIAPLLAAYAQRVTYMGGVGSGQIAKLCNQTIVATTIAAIAEAVSLAEDAGVDAARLAQALGGGWADSTLLQIFIPRMTQSPPPTQAALGTMLKDLDTIASLARSQASVIPVVAAVGQVYRLAGRQGLGPMDVSQLIQLYRSSPTP